VWGPRRVPQEVSHHSAAMVCLAVLEEGQGRTIRSLQWSPCGKYIASVSFDATCAVWELQSPQSGDAPGGEMVSDGGEMRWELAAQLEGHENEVKGVCWNNDGTLLATCGRDKRCGAYVAC
jgi:cytosolic iron-sulfur protein assembly protein CIAO1